MNFEDREQVYGRDDYYWGTEPNQMAETVVELTSGNANELTAIDIGAGEGRDAVFFAQQGWNVYAMDVSPKGLQKAERLANQRGVPLQTIRADANDVSLPEPVDVVYSAGAVQYIHPTNRSQQFDHFKQNTAVGGVHAIFAFIDHPDVPTPPDWTENEYFYAQGELLSYYEDWEVLQSENVVFDDDSGDEPHQHAAEILFVQK
ncbi:methyltransferase domain-containing protein [Haloferax sp. Atlit-4N]|uniref:S-adenosylmethionine-dependent methyltransferase n=2 Tax=Haloferax gibbonsii TaxID=35746 RepID=A0A871BIG5_HALGI|nr:MULTISPECIES: methyltransferase domain-containing protein [Haloferax]QOS12838.1 putative S-adenosylmethionine-dependent methyltransferase [Haloferax gibbonsii]RDZ52791.1 methyltransferase domain-containing protein [Haloferax sp. Atlit-4N]